MEPSEAEQSEEVYHAAAEILTDLKIASIVLLTDNPGKAEDLRRFGIGVSATQKMKITADTD
jgi:GTP cyclohydrolase II